MSTRPDGIPVLSVISIGDELASGALLDTNMNRIARQCMSRGCRLETSRVLRDDVDAITDSMKQLAAISDIVVTTGGLGPTDDDLTRDALARVIADGRTELNDEALQWIRQRYRKQGRVMPESNTRQAMQPVGATLHFNANGTAPAITASIGDCRIICLPGPPSEMVPLLEELVIPLMPSSEGVPQPIGITACGIGESAASELLGSLLQRGRDPIIGIRASESLVTATISTMGRTPEDHRRVQEDAERVEQAWSPWAFTREDQSLASVVVRMLREHGATLAVAESCTGGLLGGSIVDVPGSSNVFTGGWITYANQVKHDCLDVPMELIQSNGAVSRQVAAVMALSAARRAGASLSISTTGIAGPGGGSDSKPVGMVYIGLCDTRGPMPETTVGHHVFNGDRQAVRRRTIMTALQMIRWRLMGIDGTDLLGQVREGTAT